MILKTIKQQIKTQGLRMVVLSLLVTFFSSMAWADPQSADYNSSTKELKFYGDGIINSASVINLVRDAWKQEATSVTFGEGITGIAEDAFQEFPNLQSITIPTNITSIETFAFSKCPKLKTITIEGSSTASLLSLGQYAFYQDLNTSNEDLAFKLDRQVECLDYYTKNPNSNLFTPNNTYLKTIAIGSNIQSIPENLFSNCKGLTTVTFPETSNLKTIGNYAFMNCVNLVSLMTTISRPTLRLPNYITTIGEKAFYGCTKLATVSISANSNLTTIGASAFANSGIKSVSIPSGVTSLPERLFENCTSLSSVTLPSTLKSIGTATFSNTALTSISLPTGLSELGAAAFQNTKITSITIPSSIKIIQNYTFEGCTSLTTVNASSITSIGNYAFRNTGITSIAASGAFANLTAIGEEAFSGCNNLTSITLPATLKTISKSAFTGTKLTEVIIPAATTTIGNSAFENVPLTSLTLTEGSAELTIGNKAFYGTKLQSILIPARTTAIGEETFRNCDDVTSIEFAESTTNMTIGIYAFTKSNNATKTFTFTCSRPYSYTVGSGHGYQDAKGDRALFNADNLLTSVTYGKNVTMIPFAAFYNCTGLTSVSMSNVITIGGCAFSGCNSLTSITLPETLQTISESAFTGTKLTKITIPAATTSIEKNAFNSVPLTSLTFTAGTEDLSIGNMAFYGTKLQSILIPARTTAIGEEAFRNCDDVTSIEFAESTTNMTIGIYAFTKSNNATKTFTFTCSRPYSYTVGSGHGYQDAKGDRALFNADNLLTSVTYGKNVTTIPYAAFYNCSGLTSVSMTDVTTIYDYAFSGTNLQGELLIPASVKNIKTRAFAAIQNQLNVYINNTPEGITIAKDAFNLATIHYKDDMPYDMWIASFTESERLAMTELTITNNSIANHEYTQYENLFTLFPNVTDLTFGENVTKVGKNIFCGKMGQTNFEPATTPNLQHVTFKNNPEIGAYAFRYCNKLANITGTVKNVSDGSFFMCSSLPSITITDEDTIEKGAFVYCEALATVNLPKGLKSIGNQAFMGCESLKHIEIPSTVTTIGVQTFFGCHSLESIELPSDVESIGMIAFASNENLSKITCHNENPINITDNVFSGIASKAVLYVPAASIETYKADDNWSKDFNEILPIGMVEIADGEPYTRTESEVVPMVRYTRNFSTSSVNKWQALCIPFSIDMVSDDYQIGEILTFCPMKDTNGDGFIDGNDDNYLVITPCKNGKTVANAPYMIKPKKSGDIVFTEENCTLHAANAGELHFATTKTSYDIYGILQKSEVATVANQYYYMTATGTISYRKTGSTTIKPNRWYMTMTKKTYGGDEIDDMSSNAREIQIFTIGEDMDEATAIGIIEAGTGHKSEKASDNSVYTLSGMKVDNVDNLPAGIYVKNGKKFVVK
ncbi:MAG: leucine-rich repeat domain-containing protein [Prevotellaceae bacterium]|nr:leucine-rich repeat domain-containing protein [Prevotellaceae bacterium]